METFNDPELGGLPMESVKLTVEVESELLDLLPHFLKRRRAEIYTLKDLLNKKDFAQIQKISHDLKGVPGAFGYHYLVELGSLMEEAAKKQEIEILNLSIFQYEFFMDCHKIRIGGEDRIYHERDFIS